MKKYLQELIQSQSRIIIPDFGAFIISRDDGQHILFNNFLTFNDGLLVSYICEKEGVNSDQALSKINNFINEIKDELAENKEYLIEGVGVFKKSDDGSIIFIAEKNDEKLQDEKIEKEQIEEKVESHRTSSLNVDDNNLLILDEREEKPVEKPVIKPEVTPAPPKVTHTSTVTQNTNVISNKTVIEKDKNKSWIWILLVLLILLISATVIYFFTDVPDRLFNKKQEVEAPVIEVVVVVEEPEPIVEEIKKEPIIIRQHHIIVGGFKDASKAENLAQSFKSRGFEKSQFFMHKDRYLVSINWFRTTSEALRYQERIVTNNKIENWILSVDMEE